MRELLLMYILSNTHAEGKNDIKILNISGTVWHPGGTTLIFIEPTEEASDSEVDFMHNFPMRLSKGDSVTCHTHSFRRLKVSKAIFL